MSEVKLLFAGSMGAGKTTAIRAISQIDPISTEVSNTDFDESDKAETTVAMDYGELNLVDGQVLHLYGSPGQQRFEFMWPLLAEGALGVVVLLDNSRPDPLADLRRFLDAFAAHVAAGRVVAAVGRLDSHPQPSLEDYFAAVAAREEFLPVIGADVRRREDVLHVLETLFEHIETSAHAGAGRPADEWLSLVEGARLA